jgi:methylmalonyl-CoA/ethylmalonyl-CoA epimerase
MPGRKLFFDAGTLAFFQCGDIRFMIRTAEEQVLLGTTIVNFEVEDIGRTHTHSKEQCVVFLQDSHLLAKMPKHDPWLALMKDPDENVRGIVSEIPHV